MTRRLYYEDSYTTEFTSRVTAIEPRGEFVAVQLEASFFYPTSGGQMHDRGILGGVEVVDVEDLGETIVHVLRANDLPFEVGDEVEGRIDPERRRHHRQQHTGQHVLSRIVEDRLGLPTISSRLGETMNTLDLETDALSRDRLDELEDLANAVLWEGREVRIHLLDEAEAARWGLRKKVERSGPVRVIEVDRVDRCACGGTHVANTAEVGEIVIVGTEKIKKLTRVNFLCGQRAHEWRRQRHHWLDSLARDLTTGHAKVGETVAAILEESKARQKRLGALARELVESRIETWREGARVLAWEGGEAEFVVRRLDEDESLAASNALRRLVATPGTVAALVHVEGDKGHLLMARSADLDLDCRPLLTRVLESVGGRGGGRPENVRGGFEPGQVDAVLRALEALGA